MPNQPEGALDCGTRGVPVIQNTSCKCVPGWITPPRMPVRSTDLLNQTQPSPWCSVALPTLDENFDDDAPLSSNDSSLAFDQVFLVGTLLPIVAILFCGNVKDFDFCKNIPVLFRFRMKFFLHKHTNSLSFG